jgi:hypothetical protein
MSGRQQYEASMVGTDETCGHGDEQLGAAPEPDGWIVTGQGQGAPPGSQAGAARGRHGAVTADVADAERDVAGRGDGHIEEVTAEQEPILARSVATSDRHPRR